MTNTGLPLLVAALVILPASSFAQTGPRADIADRIEDRLDRIESHLDERVDLGPRDVIEDRIDRRESLRDRADLPTSRRVNRAERRSWRRWFQNN